jgi:hypothetical protein
MITEFQAVSPVGAIFVRRLREPDCAICASTYTIMRGMNTFFVFLREA